MKKNIEKFELTYKQIKACEDVAKAFKKAGEEGVCFLAKCSTICAYQTKAIKHAVPLHKTADFGEPIPYYPITGCINDSGADDTEHFPKGFMDKDEDEDEEYTELRAERLRVINQNLLEDYKQTYGNLIDGK